MSEQRTAPGGEVDQVQRRMARALERAQVGEDRQLAQEMREKGDQLANLLQSLLRTGRLYNADNRAFDQPVHDLLACLSRLVEMIGAVSIVCVEDQIYINDVRVRSGDKSGRVGELAAELRKHNVGGITFHAAPTEQDLRTFVTCFSRPPAPDAPRTVLSRSLQKRGVVRIELGGIFRYPKVGEVRSADRTNSAGLLERSNRAVDQAWSNASAGRMLNALPLRRLVGEILDAGPGSEALWDVDPPQSPEYLTHAQCVNHLSLILGKAVGLDVSSLQDLGVAALLHDIGYASSPQGFTCSGSLHHSAGHAVEGARVLALRRGFHEAKVRRVLVALHHHRDFNDPAGLPPLLARIVRVAEDYDTLTRPSGAAFSPPEALAALVASAGTRYDPVLVQLLVNALGRFPPGTLLQLDDGSVVRVVCGVRDPATFAKPRARVMVLHDGVRPDPPTVIDLSVAGRPTQILRSMEYAPKPRRYR